MDVTLSIASDVSVAVESERLIVVSSGILLQGLECINRGSLVLLVDPEPLAEDRDNDGDDGVEDDDVDDDDDDNEDEDDLVLEISACNIEFRSECISTTRSNLDSMARLRMAPCTSKDESEARNIDRGLSRNKLRRA